jgi:hypothetical protein
MFLHAVNDSSFGITTRYRLDGPGIESRLGWRDFSCAIHTGSDASRTMSTVSLNGLKLPQRGADHPPHFSIGLRVGWSCSTVSPACLHGRDLYIHLRRIYWTIPCFLCVSGWLRAWVRARPACHCVAPTVIHHTRHGGMHRAHYMWFSSQPDAQAALPRYLLHKRLSGPPEPVRAFWRRNEYLATAGLHVGHWLGAESCFRYE